LPSPSNVRPQKAGTYVSGSAPPHGVGTPQEYTVTVFNNGSITVSGSHTFLNNFTPEAVTVRAYSDNACTISVSGTSGGTVEDNAYNLNIPLVYKDATIYLRAEPQSNPSYFPAQRVVLASEAITHDMTANIPLIIAGSFHITVVEPGFGGYSKLDGAVILCFDVPTVISSANIYATNYSTSEIGSLGAPLLSGPYLHNGKYCYDITLPDSRTVHNLTNPWFDVRVKVSKPGYSFTPNNWIRSARDWSDQGLD
jgi:hypothetical protein